ncbi:hypothetical protein [Spongiibacter sp.]|uniref:hypothetical protein n=1 Tax=Spongiibacter sp. TaxID=2024860 RepID=UPI0035693D30
MERSHVYIVPENEVKIAPDVYLRYVHRYGKVVFIISPESYRKLAQAWGEISPIVKGKASLDNPDITDLLEKHKIGHKNQLFGLFAFLFTTTSHKLKIEAEKLNDHEVKVTISAKTF